MSALLGDHMPAMTLLIAKLPHDQQELLVRELVRASQRLRADAFAEAVAVVEAWSPQNATSRNSAMELRMRELAERKAADS